MGPEAHREFGYEDTRGELFQKKKKQKSPNTFTNTLSSQLQQAPEESLHLLTTAVTVAWAPIDMVTPLHLVLL